MEGLAVPFTAIAEGLDHIWTTLKGVVSGIVDGLSSVLTNVKDGIVTALTALGEFLLDGLERLFLPSEEFFDDTFGGMYDTLKNKIPVIEQLTGMWDTFYNSFSNSDSSIPTFNINYKGKEISIIDFSMYAEYRSFIHGIIICMAYFAFLKKLIARVPKLLGGFH